MSTRRYVIEHHTAHGRRQRPYWTIDIDGEVDGDYLSEWGALLEAVDAAQRDGLRGVKAEVVIRSKREGDMLVWVFGRDHYPPRRAGP